MMASLSSFLRPAIRLPARILHSERTKHRIHRGHLIAAGLILFACYAIYFRKGGLVALMVGSATVLALHLWVYRTWSPRLDRPVMIAGAAFLLWAGLSTLWSIAPDRTLEVAGTTAALAGAGAVAFMATCDLTERERRIANTGLLLSFPILLAFIAVEHVTDFAPIRAVFPLLGQRPPIWKQWLNFPLTILVVLFWPFLAAAWRRGMRAMAAAGGIALAALVLTLESGSALAALLAGLAALLLTALSARIGRFVVQAMIPISVIVFPVFFAFWKRFGVGGDWLEYLPFSYQHRLAIWQFAAETISARPISGWGLGTSRLVPGADAATEITVRSTNTDWVARYMGELMPLHPHNMVLQAILELGAIGGVMLAIVAWIATGRVMRATADRVGLLTACAGLAALFTITLLSFGMGNYGFFVAVIYLSFAIKLAADPGTDASKHTAGAQTNSAVRP